MNNKNLDHELYRKIIQLSYREIKKKNNDRRISKTTVVENITKLIMQEVKNNDNQ